MTPQPGFFMRGVGWLDEDGKHCWAAHDCVTERVVTMLPHPHWRWEDGGVKPSFTCDDCGFHSMLFTGPPERQERA